MTTPTLVELAQEVLNHCTQTINESALRRDAAGNQRAVSATVAAQRLVKALAPPDGVALIAAERVRQVSAEGWTPAHDDTHTKGELADAAACYAAAANNAVRGWPPGPAPRQWPFESTSWKPAAFGGGTVKDGGPNPDIPPAAIANLVKAGALIAAEIDRLQRAAPTPSRGAR